MNRRDFLKKASAVAASVVVANSLLKHFEPKRLMLPRKHLKVTTYSLSFQITQEMVDDDSMYCPLKHMTATQILETERIRHEQFKAAITRIHRQRLDNLLIANMRHG